MKPQKKNGKVAKITTDRREYKFFTNEEFYDLYFEKGGYYFPRKHAGSKPSKKYIYKFKMRSYKTWKHNRKTQWKS
jgi:hypothetical protein